MNPFRKFKAKNPDLNNVSDIIKPNSFSNNHSYLTSQRDYRSPVAKSREKQDQIKILNKLFPTALPNNQ